VKHSAVSEMGLLKFLQLYACIVVMVVGVLNSAESTVVIRFRRAPPPQSRFSTAIFSYSVERLEGTILLTLCVCLCECMSVFFFGMSEHSLEKKLKIQKFN
jgi:uncharacterized membrane protein YoaK (UPF0700 family)